MSNHNKKKLQQTHFFEMKREKQHADAIEAALDAINPSQAVISVIKNALSTEHSLDKRAVEAQLQGKRNF